MRGFLWPAISGICRRFDVYAWRWSRSRFSSPTLRWAEAEYAASAMAGNGTYPPRQLCGKRQWQRLPGKVSGVGAGKWMSPPGLAAPAPCRHQRAPIVALQRGMGGALHAFGQRHCAAHPVRWQAMGNSVLHQHTGIPATGDPHERGNHFHGGDLVLAFADSDAKRVRPNTQITRAPGREEDGRC